MGMKFPSRKIAGGVLSGKIVEDESNLRDPTMTEPTRLERLLFRIEAQHKCLGWAFGEIKGRLGPIFELGLGHGRTFDHLRRHLPGHDIYVFDREIDCFPDCTPDAAHMMLGDFAATLPGALSRFAGKVILVNSDVGTYDEAYNANIAAVVGRNLPSLLAPGAIVLSDLPLTLPEAWRVPLPRGVRSENYFIYRQAA